MSDKKYPNKRSFSGRPVLDPTKIVVNANAYVRVNTPYIIVPVDDDGVSNPDYSENVALFEVYRNNQIQTGWTYQVDSTAGCDAAIVSSPSDGVEITNVTLGIASALIRASKTNEQDILFEIRTYLLLRGEQGIQGIQGPVGGFGLWQGTWTSQNYVVNDIVHYTPTGSTYVCILDTTSNQNPTDNTYWGLVCAPFSSKLLVDANDNIYLYGGTFTDSDGSAEGFDNIYLISGNVTINHNSSDSRNNLFLGNTVLVNPADIEVSGADVSNSVFIGDSIRTQPGRPLADNSIYMGDEPFGFNEETVSKCLRITGNGAGRPLTNTSHQIFTAQERVIQNTVRDLLQFRCGGRIYIVKINICHLYDSSSGSNQLVYENTVYVRDGAVLNQSPNYKLQTGSFTDMTVVFDIDTVTSTHYDVFTIQTDAGPSGPATDSIICFVELIDFYTFR